VLCILRNVVDLIQVWNAPVPNPELLGLRKGLNLKKILRHFRSVVVVVEVEVGPAAAAAEVSECSNASSNTATTSNGAAVDSECGMIGRHEKRPTTWRVRARTDLSHTMTPISGPEMGREVD